MVCPVPLSGMTLPTSICCILFHDVWVVDSLDGKLEILGNDEIGTLGFRRALAEELINNQNIMKENAAEARRERRAARGTGHTLMSLPPFHRFDGSRIVTSETRYPQRTCSVCRRKCRDYCSCTPGTMLCIRCFPNHLVETEMQMQAYVKFCLTSTTSF